MRAAFTSNAPSSFGGNSQSAIAIETPAKSASKSGAAILGRKTFTRESYAGRMQCAIARRADLALALALFVCGFTLYAALAPATLELRDEGYLYAQSARSAAGEWVHRDFEDIYGPGVYALTGFVLRQFDGEILPVRTLLAALRAAEIAALYAISRRLAPRGASLVTALFSLALGFRVIWNLNSPYAANFTLAFALFGLSALLRGLERNSRPTLFFSGLLAGSSILFKQSLGLVLIAALGLGLVASSALAAEGERVRAPLPRLAVALLSLLAIASLPLIPVASHLNGWAYVAHFLPLHLLAGVLAARFARRVDLAELAARVAPRLAVFGAGVAAVLAAVALSYASQGALTPLLRHMFVYPSELVHYALPTSAPIRGACWLALALAAAELALLGVIRGKRRALFALIPAAYAAFELQARAEGTLGYWVASGAELAPAALAYLGVAFCARDLLRRETLTPRARSAFAATLLFQILLCFQIFPRAGFNLYLMLPLAPLTLAPSLELARAWIARPAAALRCPKLAWAALIAPLVLAIAPGCWQSTGELTRADRASRTLEIAGLRGLSPCCDEAAGAELADFVALLSALERLDPRDAPLAMLGNHFMLHFASARPDLFADEAYSFHLYAWDMLPTRLRERVDPPGLVERLAAHPNAIVVTADDFGTANLQRVFPELFAFVAQNYRAVQRIGTYRVWRREPT
jgi:hypothetical protein